MEFAARVSPKDGMGQTNAEVFSLLTMVMLTGLILWLLWSLDHNQRADELATSINHVAERIVNAEEAARDRIVASITDSSIAIG